MVYPTIAGGGVVAGGGVDGRGVGGDERDQHRVIYAAFCVTDDWSCKDRYNLLGCGDQWLIVTITDQ